MIRSPRWRCARAPRTLIDAPDIRPRVRPSDANGLDAVSEIAVDKIAVVRRDKLRGPVGRLEDPDIGRVNFALLMFLGLS